MAHKPAGTAPLLHDEGHMTSMDYNEHERTYAGFTKLLKWSIVGLVILLALMALFLT
jgi:hypothetical protein